MQAKIFTEVVRTKQYRPRWNRTVDLKTTQKRMYDQLRFGLKAYTENELAKLHPEDKRTIVYNNEGYWKIINRLKQEKLNKKVCFILKSVFPDLYENETTKLLTEPVFDNQFQVKIEGLEIQNGEIIDELIENRLLPKQFYEL